MKLTQLHTHLAKLVQLCRSQQVNLNQLLALGLLADADGQELPISRLARGLSLSTAALTASVDRLEDLGLAARHLVAHDRRQVRVRLTPKGLEVVTAAQPCLLEIESLSDEANETVRLTPEAVAELGRRWSGNGHGSAELGRSALCPDTGAAGSTPHPAPTPL